jgi:LAO/AO transport system kinase
MATEVERAVRAGELPASAAADRLLAAFGLE